MYDSNRLKVIKTFKVKLLRLDIMQAVRCCINMALKRVIGTVRTVELQGTFKMHIPNVRSV
jgi:hypothetical protein